MEKTEITMADGFVVHLDQTVAFRTLRRNTGVGRVVRIVSSCWPEFEVEVFHFDRCPVQPGSVAERAAVLDGGQHLKLSAGELLRPSEEENEG